MTEQQTMTLAEFLLARIAEDEAAATNWLRFEIRDGKPGNYAIPERVRAECEAKRRVVALAPDKTMWVDASTEEWGPDEAEEPNPAYDLWQQTLRILAAVYADHPDYRDEWRPVAD